VDERIRVTMASHESKVAIIAETLVQNGLSLIGLREEEFGLEEVFLRVTQGETQ
jgi:hypothetical protein